MNSSIKNIGWIGTGVMGKSMVKHLINAGYTCLIYNRTKSKAQELINNGAIWYDSPKNVTKKADIIFTIVGFPVDVEDVYFSDDGIINGIESGKIAIDMTTTKPSLAIKIYNRFKNKDAYFIDAPVSGGDIGAKNGTLSIMVGGHKPVFDNILPILKIMGKNIVYQGKSGSGQHTKMCNQIAIAGTMIGVCESLLYGYKAGLNLETMLRSITKGAAGCWTLENLAPRIIDNNFEPGFYIDHFIKDMGIAIEEAQQMNLSLPGLALVKQLYVETKSMGYGKKGTQALMLALQKLNNSDTN